MKKIVMKAVIAVMLAQGVSGCYTTQAVHENSYLALPLTVPLDIVMLPAQVGGAILLSAFFNWNM